jgi:hypothetical protein
LPNAEKDAALGERSKCDARVGNSLKMRLVQRVDARRNWGT